MVAAQHRLLVERLGLRRVFAVAGASMGGMQALEWGVRHPGFCERIVAMTPMARTAPWARAINEAARRALMGDPAFLEAAGLDDVRIHDLRHSFTTVARDEMGLGDHVIARLVGHTLSGQTSRYGEVRDATVRNAANGISRTIDQYLTGAEAKVLPFLPRLAIA